MCLPNPKSIDSCIKMTCIKRNTHDVMRRASSHQNLRCLSRTYIRRPRNTPETSHRHQRTTDIIGPWFSAGLLTQFLMADDDMVGDVPAPVVRRRKRNTEEYQQQYTGQGCCYFESNSKSAFAFCNHNPLTAYSQDGQTCRRVAGTLSKSRLISARIRTY
jgi:hypothetical protein